ncbi:hypothetical protein E2562_027851 [Oryza meyeriana var. granulata]|uniref:Uncharacterized protein n=1 Tax=Oryza meyeriana var. granulata TaxID=110450 RepID=A0A6G1DQD1_9ORYZ|nr:hypothetical protein E2562_027851 [Oryza meyeriana var. granulata]
MMRRANPTASSLSGLPQLARDAASSRPRLTWEAASSRPQLTWEATTGSSGGECTLTALYRWAMAAQSQYRRQQP